MGNERVCQISDFQLVGKWVKFRLENLTPSDRQIEN